MRIAAPLDDASTGVRALLRFGLRRERIGLPCWILGSVILLGYQSWGSQTIYGTPEKLAAIRTTMGDNSAIVAMSGPSALLETIGGEVTFEIFGYLSIVVALMNMFLVARRTRTDEENGRSELLRSTPIGRSAPTLAALSLAFLANLLLAVGLFVVAVATGLPAMGSGLSAVALAGVGLTYAGITAVAAQVFENPRSVYGAVTTALGVAYALRAIGDVGGGLASWLSPIGWGQQTLPYVQDRWWPLLMPLAATTLLIAVALALLDRRDFGAGLLGYRTGRAHAGWTLRSALGLTWRLQRGSLAAWACGAFLLAAAYGSFTSSIDDYIADNPEIAAYLPGGAQSAVSSYIALTMTIMALLAAAHGVATVLHAHGEEAAGRAESILAAPTSRARWLASYVVVAMAGSLVVLIMSGAGEGIAYGLAISDAGQVPRHIGIALSYVPATWLIVAVAVIAFGWFTRGVAAIAWTTFAYCTVIALFAESFKLPEWIRVASPLDRTPQFPLESLSPTTLLLLLLLTAVVVSFAFAGFRKRDIEA